MPAGLSPVALAKEEASAKVHAPTCRSSPTGAGRCPHLPNLCADEGLTFQKCRGLGRRAMSFAVWRGRPRALLRQQKGARPARAFQKCRGLGRRAMSLAYGGAARGRFCASRRARGRPAHNYCTSVGPSIASDLPPGARRDPRARNGGGLEGCATMRPRQDGRCGRGPRPTRTATSCGRARELVRKARASPGTVASSTCLCKSPSSRWPASCRCRPHPQALGVLCVLPLLCALCSLRLVAPQERSGVSAVIVAVAPRGTQLGGGGGCAPV